MSPLSATFACRFETRSQYVRLVFDLKLILKSININGKVGGPGLSVFGWWRGVLSGQLIVGRQLRGVRRRGGVCRVLSTEWSISVWMETASSRAYTMVAGCVGNEGRTSSVHGCPVVLGVTG